ncbi:hypothetical protein Y032_0043g854 [Ancylostoma ceylanicum]|uniref:Uncharacterized protein n=1 Tax=Ancylostoma ceylanicum TaxID=53326 RepID=A0A016UFN6_9BILA|nr:hypothetical protein Y032_0043g854 [Ancylostoma ceylanicum]
MISVTGYLANYVMLRDAGRKNWLANLVSLCCMLMNPSPALTRALARLPWVYSCMQPPVQNRQGSSTVFLGSVR